MKFNKNPFYCPCAPLFAAVNHLIILAGFYAFCFHINRVLQSFNIFDLCPCPWSDPDLTVIQMFKGSVREK